MNNSKANSEAKIFYKFLNDWLEFVFDGAAYDMPWTSGDMDCRLLDKIFNF